MRIQIPRIVKALPLADYAPELKAVTIFVWVNPPVEVLDRKNGLEGDRLFAWWAELWSQGADPGSRWTGDDVRDLVTQTADTDPGLARWLVQRSWNMINEHREQAKKA